MKRLFYTILSAFLIVCTTSCVKEKDFTPSQVTAVTSMKNLEAAADFDWATTKKISFEFTGSAVNEYKLVLKLVSADGAVLFQKLQKSTESYKATIDIPVQATGLVLQYGDVKQTPDATTGNISLTVTE